MSGEPNARWPHTRDEAAGGNVVDQIDRYHELTTRDVMARAIANLKARGTYDPAIHPDAKDYPSLTTGEHLELLAIGENLARYYRHPSQVDHAVKAGATWAQIAAATDEHTARHEYRAWADSQQSLWTVTSGRFGIDDTTHAAALQRAVEPTEWEEPAL